MWMQLELNTSSIRWQLGSLLFLQPCWETVSCSISSGCLSFQIDNLRPLYLFSFHELDSLRPCDLDVLFPLTPLLEMCGVLCTPDVLPVTMRKWRDSSSPGEHCRHPHRYNGLALPNWSVAFASWISLIPFQKASPFSCPLPAPSGTCPS